MRSEPEWSFTSRSTSTLILDIGLPEMDGFTVLQELRKLFFTHPGQVLSREQILSHVWGYDFDPGSNVVEVYVSYLRKKLGNDCLATVRGMGYRLEAR